jgi:hypothetical protein
VFDDGAVEIHCYGHTCVMMMMVRCYRLIDLSSDLP